VTEEKVFNEIVEAIRAERMYQIEKWGDTFDDNNTINDWVCYIIQYAGSAAPLLKDDELSRKKLIKVATLAISAIMALERNESFPYRHYDERPREDRQYNDDTLEDLRRTEVILERYEQ
jgi:hypothetical protein